MDQLVVVNADIDRHGARKENIFVALDGTGAPIGSMSIYPFFAYDTEPEHPHNLYLHLQAEQGRDLSDFTKDVLLESALQRAGEIKSEAGQIRTRVYACFFKRQQEEIAYFLQRGFVHDEGMLILEKREPAALPPVEVPTGIAIQSWRMDTVDDQNQFIETHRTIFPRHPYSLERLRELKSMPGWNNFTAFGDGEIAGNIMVFVKSSNPELGYVEDLFVQRQWRRRGVGKCLLHTALTYFQGIGIQRVQLEMWSANKPALHLYRLFGFLQIDETEIAVGRYL